MTTNCLSRCLAMSQTPNFGTIFRPEKALHVGLKFFDYRYHQNLVDVIVVYRTGLSLIRGWIYEPKHSKIPHISVGGGISPDKNFPFTHMSAQRAPKILPILIFYSKLGENSKIISASHQNLKSFSQKMSNGGNTLANFSMFPIDAKSWFRPPQDYGGISQFFSFNLGGHF